MSYTKKILKKIYFEKLIHFARESNPRTGDHSIHKAKRYIKKKYESVENECKYKKKNRYYSLNHPNTVNISNITSKFEKGTKTTKKNFD